MSNTEQHQHSYVQHYSGEHGGYVLRCTLPGCGYTQPALPTAELELPAPQEQEVQRGEQTADDQQSQETGDGTGGQAEGAPETQTKKVVKARAEKV